VLNMLQNCAAVNILQQRIKSLARLNSRLNQESILAYLKPYKQGEASSTRREAAAGAGCACGFQLARTVRLQIEGVHIARGVHTRQMLSFLIICHRGETLRPHCLINFACRLCQDANKGVASPFNRSYWPYLAISWRNRIMQRHRQ